MMCFYSFLSRDCVSWSFIGIYIRTMGGAYHAIRYFVAKHLFMYLRRKYNLFLSPGCFGKGLHIVHFGYIWADNSCVIGK